MFAPLLRFSVNVNFLTTFCTAPTCARLHVQSIYQPGGEYITGNWLPLQINNQTAGRWRLSRAKRLILGLGRNTDQLNHELVDYLFSWLLPRRRREEAIKTGAHTQLLDPEFFARRIC